jgi:hypothetical protein
MARKTIDRIVLAILIAGAIVFVLLLAGVGSETLMNPSRYGIG